MKTKFLLFYILLLFCCYTLPAQSTILYFTSVQGKQSKADSIIFPLQGRAKNFHTELKGEHRAHFNITEKQVPADKKSVIIWVRYDPPKGFTGISTTTLELKSGKKAGTYLLKGMCLSGLEGNNEATLATIFNILDLKTDPGWTSLAHHTRPELQGDEVNGGLFEKVNPGPVMIQPLARFSPPYLLPYGYYLNTSEGPALKQVGILADSKKFHEHQTIFPSISNGSTSFDPGNASFGFYVVSPTHNSYTERDWNQIKYPDRTSHAARIYPAKNKTGEIIKNTYLICFEEASNGDYQDYIFTISNVQPVDPDRLFSKILAPNDLSGWDIFLQSKGINNDPEKIFTIEDGILRDMGKELGYIITKDSYTNYHLKLEFKWGQQKWPPRDNAKRDSGICYHIPDDETNKVWPQSVECQIQEGDVGDFWLLGYSTIEVNGKQNEPLQHSRMTKFADNELPNGEWNTVEVLTFNGICVHIVNGMIVNYGTNSSLRKGRILLQSEYAEVYYRNVTIRKL